MSSVFDYLDSIVANWVNGNRSDVFAELEKLNEAGYNYSAMAAALYVQERVGGEFYQGVCSRAAVFEKNFSDRLGGVSA